VPKRLPDLLTTLFTKECPGRAKFSPFVIHDRDNSSKKKDKKWNFHFFVVPL
jgi:hypothetical protein